jgi:hypothetical protein
MHLCKVYVQRCVSTMNSTTSLFWWMGHAILLSGHCDRGRHCLHGRGIRLNSKHTAKADLPKEERKRKQKKKKSGEKKKRRVDRDVTAYLHCGAWFDTHFVSYRLEHGINILPRLGASRKCRGIYSGCVPEKGATCMKTM